ncbi:MAG TPA: hypothetical protein DEQ28_01845 [Clostridiales bacterium]|nr:hypothetical protein [Clostridiales bacterium]
MFSNYKLLCMPFEELSLEQRCNALQAAREAGAEEARADRGAAGGIDQPAADYRDYVARLVEPAGAADEIDEVLEARWRHGEFAADPRVEAFCQAWAADMAEAQARLDEEWGGGARG